jgi:chromatin remodeling complex protein RSC6
MNVDEIALQFAAIRAENKAIIKLLRKVRATQQDPDGSKAQERAANNGFKKPLDVTDALRAFLGLAEKEQISRSEVTKRISAYVTENNLKHPDSGRVIVLDDKLKTLLNTPEGIEITFLNIQKYLSPHYIKPEGAAPPKEKKVKDPAAAAPPAKKAKVAPAPEPVAAAAPTAEAPKRPVVKRKAPVA